MLRLVPKPVRAIARVAGEGYVRLLTGLLVLIAGCLVLTLLLSVLGI